MPTVSGVSDGASKLQKVEIEEIQKCNIESIELVLNNSTVSVFDKEKNIDIKKLYFLSNQEGKEIEIKTKRVNEDKCRKKEEHGKFLHNTQSIDDSGSAKISLKHKELPLMSHVKNVNLPELKSGDSRYVEEELFFASCENKKNVQIIVYPEVKYAFQFGGEDDGTNYSLSAMYGKDKHDITLDSSEQSPIVSALSKFGNFFHSWLSIEEYLKKTLSSDKAMACIKINLNTPSIKILWEWQYCISEDHTEISKHHKIDIELNPLFGTSIKVELLKLAMIAVSGGTLAPLFSVAAGVNGLASKLGWGGKIYVDLIFTGNITAGLKGNVFLPATQESTLVLQGNLVFEAELKAGASIKASVCFFSVNAEASASGKISVTLGGEFVFSKSKVVINLPITLIPFQVTLIGKARVQLFSLRFGPSKEYKKEFKKHEWKPNIGELNFR